MDVGEYFWVKFSIFFVLVIVAVYSLSYQSNQQTLSTSFKILYQKLNQSQILDTLKKLSPSLIFNATILEKKNTTGISKTTIVTTTLSTTKTTGTVTTLDPAEVLSERPPLPSFVPRQTGNGSIVAFIFQTQHHYLASVQMYMIRRLAINLVGIELFLDGRATDEMKETAKKYGARIHTFLPEMHKPGIGPSDRNADVVNWAIATEAKAYLKNGTAILLLDGDVFPLSYFDSVSLLNNRDLVCRKHPAIFARYCWIGFICLGPQMYNHIDDFNVSQDMRNGKAYDSGGKTAEFLLKYENTTFSYMRETIFLQTDKDLFWGTTDDDIRWIGNNFGRCDKCGPEIFFSPFQNSNAVFYHMISATSEWRFGHQGGRRKNIYDAVMKSPYGPDKTLSAADLLQSVAKVKKMDVIPIFGNLTCERICGRR